jgi:hypothetical protein
MAAQSIALNPRFSRATPVDSEWRVPEHVGSRFPEVAEPGLVEAEPRANAREAALTFYRAVVGRHIRIGMLLP